MRLELTDIRQCWDSIAIDVEALRFTYGLDWRPEDIYAECRMGLAFCWLCGDGFVIVKPHENRFNNDKELFVWICVSRRGDGMVEYYDDLCEIAKDIGATKIKFESQRQGFHRVAKEKGWTEMTEYTIKL